MENKYPIYDIIVDFESTDGVGVLSLVDDPAIERNWIALAAEKEQLFLAQQEKQELWGPLLIPDKLIFRNPNAVISVPHYVRFSKEQIQIIADKFNKDLNNLNISYMHLGIPVNGFLSSNWITEDGDKSFKKGFTDLPEGTWFGIVKIEDTNFWSEEVKSGNLNGFSVEISYSDLVMADEFNKVDEPIELLKPTPNDTQEEFLPKCIAYVINEGKSQEEAVAQCNSEWDNHSAEQTLSKIRHLIKDINVNDLK